MNSKELVRRTILGENDTGVTPVYGWVSANLDKPISEAFGSVRAFEDHYRFDMAHIFGGPSMYEGAWIEEIRQRDGEVTPEAVLQLPLRDPDQSADYEGVLKELDFYSRERERFCYIQSGGIFEPNNGVFGIENHLCHIALYPEQLKELYARQALWNARVANNMLDLGVDMVHVSDDWGAQNSLLFSPDFLRDCILPSHRVTIGAVKKRKALISLHSDGCITPALEVIAELGYNLVHPWQENAGMPYGIYLEKYRNQFAILGGLCIQSTLGFGDYDRVQSELNRVFSLLRGERFILCTTHFVQEHCSMDELCFAYDLIMRLANKA